MILAQDKDFYQTGESEFLPIKLDKEGNPKGTLSAQTLSAYVDYALKLSEKAAEQISNGVIIASPFGDHCKYCKFKALCEEPASDKRTLGTVDQDTIRQSVEGGEEPCQN